MIVFRGENFDGSRNYDRLVNGYRAIDRSVTDPRAPNYYDPNMEVFNFTNPRTGAVSEGQYRRAGIDVGNVTNGQSNAFNRVQQPFGETLDPMSACSLTKTSRAMTFAQSPTGTTLKTSADWKPIRSQLGCER